MRHKTQRRKKIFVFLIFGSLVSSLWSQVLVSAEPSAQQQWSFDKDPEGLPPPHWTAGRWGQGDPSRWAVLKYPQASTPPKVLSQQSIDPAPMRLPIILAPRESERDVEVQMRIQCAGGEVYQVGGIALRWDRQERKGYTVGLDVHRQILRCDRWEIVPGGASGGKHQLRRTNLAVVHFPLEIHHWYVLKAEAYGHRITVWLDDKVMFRTFDENGFLLGQSGLWTLGDSILYFDDVSVAHKEPEN